MPELCEVEAYRLALRAATGRTIEHARLADPTWVRGSATAAAVADLAGWRLAGVRRHGKVLLVDLAPPGASRVRPALDVARVLGLRFGMTGVLAVDGVGAIDGLVYGPARLRSEWVRFELRVTDLGVAVYDARRLGSVELDPDVGVLGADALTIDRRSLAAVVAVGRAPVKARLLDQRRIAGLGNLLVDEILWRAGIDPARPGSTLGDAEVASLHRTIATTVRRLSARGGSHTGDLMHARAPGGCCPTDGTPLLRRTVAGRTTWSCPHHQR